MGVRWPAAWWAAAGFGLLVLVIAAAFFGPAASLHPKMTQRFLEAEGRSPEQLAAQAAAERRAEEERQRRAEEERLAAEARQQEQARREAEQRRVEAERLAAERRAEEEARRRAQLEAEARQRQAQEERQRAPTRLAELNQEWRNLTQAYRPAVADIRGFSFSGQEALRGSNRSGQIYDDSQRCNDPSSSFTRDQNIDYCARFVAQNRDRLPAVTRDMVIALYWRTFVRGSDRDLSIPELVAYSWIYALTQAARQERAPPFLPPLMEGHVLHPMLILPLPTGFSRRLIETATAREIETVRTRTYPDMLRLFDILREAQSLCRLIQRTPCFNVEHLVPGLP
jgi:flagellar biosynthesis GTPase FlhF